jgi:hypothetical protein
MLSLSFSYLSHYKEQRKTVFCWNKVNRDVAQETETGSLFAVWFVG